MDKSVNKIDRNFRKTQSNNSYRSPLSPTQCCYNFRLILNVVQQHCVGGRGGDVLDKIQESNYNLNSRRCKLKFY
jgi:hypothetical protein